MADKEATVYIVDVGESMGDCHNGRVESDLDWAMRYVWDQLSAVVATARKTLTVGVVGLNTDDTANEEARGLQGYENISVIHELGMLTLPSLRDLRGKIRPSRSCSGDAISAIVVALGMITRFTKELKYKRKIVLVTNGEYLLDPDSFADVAEELNAKKVELVVLGVDFDDAEYGFKEEDKTSFKATNEALLKALAAQVKLNTFGTMAEAIEELETPRVKPVRPFKAYDGALKLGDPDKYEGSAVSIHVERYFKTKSASAPTASTVVDRRARMPGEDDEDAQMDSINHFASVERKRTFTVKNPDEPGGKQDALQEDLAKGYEYGRTAVAISESESNITKLATKKDFSIIGFVPADRYEPFLNMGETGIVVAAKIDAEAEIALSAFIHALHEAESYAIARYVSKDGASPQILVLKPNPGTEDEFECLYDIPMPFAEDVRSYPFPPLDKVLTITGKAITKDHRLLPSGQLSQAMSDFVDAMDLATFGTDADGQAADLMPLDDMYNPKIHRINKAIRARAINPEEPVGPTAEILTRFSRPPENLVGRAQLTIDALIKAAEVKKVPDKVKPKRYGRSEKAADRPMSGREIDVAALLQSGGGSGSGSRVASKRSKISADNAIPEFKQALSSAADDAAVERAADEMGKVVQGLIERSFADQLYEQAAENLRVMREAMVELEFPALYNDRLRALKEKILSGALAGDRREMWIRFVVGRRLGLITQAESGMSEVTADEAKAFTRI